MRRHLSKPKAVTDEDLDVLMEKTIGGNARARQELWVALDPRIEKIAGHCRVIGRIAGRVDERHDIVALVIAELFANGYALVRTLLERLRRRDQSFERMLTTISTHTAIDFTRAHAEYGAGPASSRWANHVALLEVLAANRPDADQMLLVDEILCFIERHLPPQQGEALLRWAAGESKEEIAEVLGLRDAAAAMRLVRAAQKRVRDRFAPRRYDGGGLQRKSTGRGDGSTKNVANKG